MSENWDPLADSFALTKAEIEQQVSTDLAKFYSEYSRRFRIAPTEPLDIEMFVNVLWAFNVVYEEIEQVEGEETLGTLRPETQDVVVDSNCTHHARLSFTIAHEAGHLSLHGQLFRREGEKIVGWTAPTSKHGVQKDEVSHTRHEWQANVYAGALLAPQAQVIELLREVGAVNFPTITSFSLDEHFEKFESKFGLSRQALEIRLDHLNLPFTDRQYRQV